MVTEVLLKVPACSTNFYELTKENQTKLKLPLIESNRLCKNFFLALKKVYELFKKVCVTNRQTYLYYLKPHM